MKTNKILHILLSLCTVFGFISCSDNDNWREVTEVQQGTYISGSATVYSSMGPASSFTIADLELTDAQKGKEFPEILSRYTWLKAGGELVITKADKEGYLTTYGKGAEVSKITNTLQADGTPFSVEKDGLYFLVYNTKLNQLTIIPAHFGIIGDATEGGWDKEVLFDTPAYDDKGKTVTFNGKFLLSKNQIKVRFNNTWGIDIAYSETESVNVFTNQGAVAENDKDIALSKSFIELKSGGKNLRVDNTAVYEISMVYSLRSGKFTISAIPGEIIAPTYPEELYMVGEEFGNWNWSDVGIVPLAPVHGVEGAFWTIKYFTKDKSFKWSPQKDWGGDFSGLKENTGFKVIDGNAQVEEDGLYMVYIDMKADKMVIEKPQVYGIGDAFGTWDAKTQPFTIDGKSMKITTLNTELKNLRMHTTSSLAEGIDWWKMEFNIFDGKIVYRGNGGDQDEIPVGPSSKVTLDFSNDTGKIE